MRINTIKLIDRINSAARREFFISISLGTRRYISLARAVRASRRSIPWSFQPGTIDCIDQSDGPSGGIKTGVKQGFSGGRGEHSIRGTRTRQRRIDSPISMTGVAESQVSDPRSIVFLLDVDNTLLDNDRLKADLKRRFLALLGQERSDRFWQIYEEVRRDEDFVDYPLTFKRMAEEQNDPELRTSLETVLEGLQFSSYLYPGVLGMLAYLRTLGTPVILSDGDHVFQPYKIRYSGLERAVDGHVLIYVHKEKELPSVFAQFPADHYVAVDDKPRILAALESECPTTFTTVLVLQGTYAVQGPSTPPPDYVIDRIAALHSFSRERFLTNSTDSDSQNP